MIRSEVVRQVEHEHCMDVKIDVEIYTDSQLFVPELITIIKECYKTRPDMTIAALDNVLPQIIKEEKNAKN